MQRQTAKEVAEVISRYVNGAGTEDISALADEILWDHRTLQQQTFGLMMTCIEKWARVGLTPNFDARNEYTVKLCKMMFEAVKDEWYGRVPLI